MSLNHASRQPNDDLWFGDEASARAAQQAEALIAATLVAGKFDEEVNPAYMLNKVGNVGVVRIRGALLNTDSPIAAYFGIATYPGIRHAVIEAAKDPAIDQILLDVDSGGGAVSGVVDTGDLIRRVDRKLKPITTFSDGAIASAAYWLAAASRKIHVGKTTISGSIGVITTHIDYSEAMKKEGVKATVLRAGKHKALSNPMEPLSKEARAQIQERLDAAYKIFVEHVAAARGVTYAKAHDTMADGREFFGQQAVDVGLVDSVSTFDATLAELSAKKKVDSSGRKYDNGIKGELMNKSKAVLTDADIAALAAGATLLEPGAGEVVVDPAAAPAAPAPAAPAAADSASAAPAAPAPAPAAPDQAPAPAPAAAADTAIVAYLQAQVVEKDAKILADAVALQGVTAKLAGFEASHGALVEIARLAVGNMRVALGSGAGDLAALSPVELAAEHGRLSALFKAKFKVGGVAAVAVETTVGASGVRTGERAAQLAAVKTKK